MITSDDKVYSQLVDDLFTGLDREIELVLEGVVPSRAAPLYIYVVSRPDGRRHSMYYSCAVVAVSEDDARQIHPDWYNDYPNRVWVSGWVPVSDIHLLKVYRVGVADEGMVAGTVLVSDYDP